jgi:DNA-binding LacI/PurR family transcriptional regulator
MPVVHSFGRYTTAPHVHVVGIDNVACGRMAAEALIARGYTRVAFLGGPESATSTQDRARGFFGALAEHPDVERRVSYASAYSFDAGRVEMTKLLMSDPAEAYFCGDDVLSDRRAQRLAARRACRVPGDIGLIGLNDMEMAGLAEHRPDHHPPAHRRDHRGLHRACRGHTIEVARTAPGDAAVPCRVIEPGNFAARVR